MLLAIAGVLLLWNKVRHYNIIIFAAVFLLQVEKLIVEVQDVAYKFLGLQTKRRKVSVHHHSVRELVNFDVTLDIVGVVDALLVAYCGVPTKFCFKLFRKYNSVCLIVRPQVVPEICL